MVHFVVVMLDKPMGGEACNHRVFQSEESYSFGTEMYMIRCVQEMLLSREKHGHLVLYHTNWKEVELPR